MGCATQEPAERPPEPLMASSFEEKGR